MDLPPIDPDARFAHFRVTGDPHALADVYDHLAPELLRIALHTTRDAAVAEDVLQSTFLAAIEESRRFDPHRRLMPWLVGILGNEAARARARMAREPDPARLDVKPGESPDDAAQRTELLSKLDAAFERVPPAYRPVLQLRLRHDLSIPEIAAALERPPGTVRSQLARGTEILRRVLPASLAGALLAFAAPTRGLAAVKSEILAHAPALKAGASAASFVAGVLAMKKLAIALLALAALGWWWWPERSRIEPALEARAGAAQPAALAREPAEPPSEAEVLAATDQRRAEAAPEPAAPSAPAKPAAKPSLIVHARWSDGTPAEAEVVIVTPIRTRLDDALAATTDEKGTAVFSDLRAGGAHVQLLRGASSNVVLREGRAAELTLSIDAGADVEGRVVDSRGEPVANASIWLSRRYRDNLGHEVATSDARGEFTVRSVPPDHYVGARARGFAPSSLRPVSGAAGERVRVELFLDGAAAPLVVEVVDAAGAPIAAARVLLGAERPASVRQEDGTFAPGPPPQRATTGADGLATLECAALGTGELRARAEGFAPELVLVDVAAGSTNRRRIALRAEARLEGSAVDATGAPVAGAWVSVGEPERFESAWTNTRSDGKFELAGLPSGRHGARILHETLGSAEREVELAAGGVETWHATLVRAPSIEGVVLGPDGAPRAGVLVIAVASVGEPARTRSDASDAAGHFRIADVEACAHRLLVHSPNGWRDFPLLEVDGVWPGGEPCVLRLDEARAFGRIALSIEDSAGKPLAGVELQVGHEEQRTWRSFASDGEGKVEVGNVRPGTLELQLRHADYPWKRLGKHALAAGETLDLGRIALDPAGSLAVELRGLPPEACARLKAVLTDSTWLESGAPRIAGCRLTANALAAGRHTLRISGEGWQQIERELVISAGVRTELALDFLPAAVREVRFRWPADAAAPAWIAFSLLDEHGALVFGGNADCAQSPPCARVSAKPGTYRLWAGAAGELSARTEMQLPELGAAAQPLIVDLARQP